MLIPGGFGIKFPNETNAQAYTTSGGPKFVKDVAAPFRHVIA